MMLFPDASKQNFPLQLRRKVVVVGVLLTYFVFKTRETGRFQTLLTLTAGPGSGHTVVKESHRAVPVGSADA